MKSRLRCCRVACRLTGLAARRKSHPSRSLSNSHRKLTDESSNKKQEDGSLERLEEIEKLLSTPTWTIESLLPHVSVGELHPDINPTSLRDLLRRSGLQFPKTDAEEQQMLADLQRQLSFVDHVQDVDTVGVRPLNRVGLDDPPLTWDDIATEQESMPEQAAIADDKKEREYFYVTDEKDRG
ncbi:hypothetical protein V1512DRAFT_264644 [Lipomyces arxii]|uniref:uncharacterized protein n=1 Tax=Lipomyces arxii TaxID=56418 RepID=UPI0034CEE9EA